jgi:hypothetical protein
VTFFTSGMKEVQGTAAGRWRIAMTRAFRLAGAIFNFRNIQEETVQKNKGEGEEQPFFFRPYFKL